ncbi:hypothetical protein CASFOL_028501 [Castilleja foliolosa]|uniref:Uncharacterized protein n=1 Tax=Castilleja foliolosa TaxID=1961234 RepID=A0ABD3CC42_9LAMI
MSGKGAKGLLPGKTPASKDKDKDKKKPTSRSSRAGLQGSKKAILEQQCFRGRVTPESVVYNFGTILLDLIISGKHIPPRRRSRRFRASKDAADAVCILS